MGGGKWVGARVFKESHGVQSHIPLEPFLIQIHPKNVHRHFNDTYRISSFTDNHRHPYNHTQHPHPTQSQSQLKPLHSPQHPRQIQSLHLLPHNHLRHCHRCSNRTNRVHNNGVYPVLCLSWLVCIVARIREHCSSGYALCDSSSADGVAVCA